MAFRQYYNPKKFKKRQQNGFRARYKYTPFIDKIRDSLIPWKCIKSDGAFKIDAPGNVQGNSVFSCATVFNDGGDPNTANTTELVDMVKTALTMTDADLQGRIVTWGDQYYDFILTNATTCNINIRVYCFTPRIPLMEGDTNIDLALCWNGDFADMGSAQTIDYAMTGPPPKDFLGRFNYRFRQVGYHSWDLNPGQYRKFSYKNRICLTQNVNNWYTPTEVGGPARVVGVPDVTKYFVFLINGHLAGSNEVADARPAQAHCEAHVRWTSRCCFKLMLDGRKSWNHVQPGTDYALGVIDPDFEQVVNDDDGLVHDVDTA